MDVVFHYDIVFVFNTFLCLSFPQKSLLIFPSFSGSTLVSFCSDFLPWAAQMICFVCKCLWYDDTAFIVHDYLFSMQVNIQNAFCVTVCKTVYFSCIEIFVYFACLCSYRVFDQDSFSS